MCLSIRSFRTQESDIREQTRSVVPGFFEFSEQALDTLIQLLYDAPRHRSVSPSQDEFAAQSVHWFYSAVYTATAATSLMETGYYLEARILFRALVEVLVKLAYFNVHPADMKKLPTLSAGKRTMLSWKAMFDSIWPGYYEEYSTLSYKVHGGIGANAYRLKRGPVGYKRELTMGLEYSEFWASAFINQLTPVLLGYLRTFVRIFGTDWMSSELSQQYSASTKLLETAISGHIAKFGKNDWHRRVEVMWKP
jgi:hypothetical protein